MHRLRGVYQGSAILSRGPSWKGGKCLKAETIPRDLITSNEALELYGPKYGLKYERLKFWWMRGHIRSWTLNKRVLVSRAEVLRELRRRDGVKPRVRKGRQGELTDEALVRGMETPRVARPTTPPPLPELPDRAAGWTSPGPWGYTTD